MQRRQFLKTSCLIGCTSGSILLSACSSANYYAKYLLAEKRVRIARSEFSFVTKKGEARERDFVLVKPDNFPFPIALYRTAGGYSACLMRCTHQSCEVEVQGSRYACPCHGSEFDVQGKVLQGPAEQPLQSFKTEEDEQYIYILLG